MTRSRSSEQARLTSLAMRLIAAERHRQVDYVLGILKTDAAEAGEVPADQEWLRPGQVPGRPSPVYEAALRWCRDASGGTGRS